MQSEIQSRLAEEFTRSSSSYFSELSEFLKFKSISTDSAFAPDCLKCAEWLRNHIAGIGFAAQLLQTESKPVVYGELKVAQSARTVLFYGHYDVQPVDPLNLWQSDPFEPIIRDGRIYARGAQDNKGQLFYVLKALQFLVKSKLLSCNVKVLIEGEEECGSKGLSTQLGKWKDRLGADLLMVCDTGSLQAGLPAITMGLRGIAALEAILRGPHKDLHSGVHGGVVRNPATELARLVAGLHKSDGSIAIPGFYEGMKQASQSDRALANAIPLSEEQYRQLVGAAPDGGELGYSMWERRGMRPTIEVNGFHSGYGGEGGKTIIPSSAEVKLSMRLVPGQNPQRCLELLREYFVTNTPKSLALSFGHHQEGAEAVAISSSDPAVKLASDVLAEVCGIRPLYLWEGSSIPIVTELSRVSGGTPLLVGFGLEEDNIHAPNESFSLDQFRLGFLYAGAFLDKFGRSGQNQ